MKAQRNIATVLLLLLLGSAFSGAGAEDGSFVMADLSVNGADFAAGLRPHLVLTPEGLALETGRTNGSFTSPVLQAPIPFNALVPTWTAQVPEDSDLTLRLRTAPVSGTWSEWVTLALNDDWMEPGDTAQMGQMIVVPAVDVNHRRIQV